MKYRAVIKKKEIGGLGGSLIYLASMLRKRHEQDSWSH